MKKHLRLALCGGLVVAAGLVPASTTTRVAQASTISDAASLVVAMARAVRPCLQQQSRAFAAYNALKGHLARSSALQAQMGSMSTTCENDLKALGALEKRMTTAMITSNLPVTTFAFDEIGVCGGLAIASRLLYVAAGGDQSASTYHVNAPHMLQAAKQELDGYTQALQKRNRDIPLVASKLHVPASQLQ